ncbi:unnamed protein product, partial [Iphiclides podalirius]
MVYRSAEVNRVFVRGASSPNMAAAQVAVLTSNGTPLEVADRSGNAQQSLIEAGSKVLRAMSQHGHPPDGFDTARVEQSHRLMVVS